MLEDLGRYLFRMTTRLECRWDCCHGTVVPSFSTVVPVTISAFLSHDAIRSSPSVKDQKKEP